MDELTSIVIITTMPLCIHNIACDLLELVYKNVALMHDILISVTNIEIAFNVRVLIKAALSINEGELFCLFLRSLTT